MCGIIDGQKLTSRRPAFLGQVPSHDGMDFVGACGWCGTRAFRMETRVSASSLIEVGIPRISTWNKNETQ